MSPAAAAAVAPVKKSANEQHWETMASLVRTAKTKEGALAAVEKYCDEMEEEKRFARNTLISHMTEATKILKRDNHPLQEYCKYTEMTNNRNDDRDVRATTASLSPDARLQLDLDVDIYPRSLRILQANKDGRTHVDGFKLHQKHVAIAVIAMTGRRRGEVVDGREGAPVWDFTSEREDMVTLSFLKKQRDPHPHTFPVLCDRALVEHGVKTVQAFYLEKLQRKTGSGDNLTFIGSQVNPALTSLFPEVAAAWATFCPKIDGEKGFTQHALRAFYGAKLWSIHGTDGGIYLAHLKEWLGHLDLATSAIYDKVRHVSGVKLTAGAAVAEPEPETEGELIDLMLTRVTNSELLSKGRKRKLQGSLASMIVDIGKEEQKAEKAAAAAAKKAAVEAKAAAKKQKA
jgi:hypothetical protein